MKLFVISPNHTLDIITNSSSELFVLRGLSIKIIKEMIKEVYPDYLKEYYPVKHSEKLTGRELAKYLSYAYEHNDYSNNTYRSIKNPSLPDRIYSFYEYPDYHDKEKKHKTWYIDDRKVSKCKRLILDIIDPDRQMYFLFSKDENPEWEYQEKLESLGSRYHLG